MAGSFKLEINVEGFNAIRTDPDLQNELHERGLKMAAAAGGAPDFEVIDSPSKTRARVIVRTATVKGMIAEAKDRELTRAFEAARG